MRSLRWAADGKRWAVGGENVRQTGRWRRWRGRSRRGRRLDSRPVGKGSSWRPWEHGRAWTHGWCLGDDDDDRMDTGPWAMGDGRATLGLLGYCECGR
jgi:hypothetical protein